MAFGHTLVRDPLWSWTARIGVVLAVWFVTGPVWVALGPRKTEASRSR